MTNRYNLAVVMSAVVLLCCAALTLDQKVNAAGEGRITGTVKFDGTAPHMRGIDMSKDPYCAKANASSPVHLENVVVGQGGGLENVVLYISDWSGSAQASTLVPVFDQKNCLYTPHVLAIDAGQTFKVATSDQTAHNIHPNPNPMTGNIPWNLSQPPGAPPIEKSWKAAEVIPVQCNIHPWMHGWFVVVKGPYATTDSNGNYTIENVPPGNYTVTAWQEDYGTQTQTVTVAPRSPERPISLLRRSRDWGNLANLREGPNAIIPSIRDSVVWRTTLERGRDRQALCVHFRSPGSWRRQTREGAGQL